VFCAGDAVHRHPPSNGLGSNTSIQDAYNLAWKLPGAARRRPAPELLDTYTRSGRPIGRQIVDRANQSIGETGRIFQALGLLSTEDPEQMRANMDARKLPPERGRSSARSCARRSSSRTTSSTPTASSSTSATARRRAAGRHDGAR
jgi:2-polyprenyl-6-methoxyphenol hydroxylase-like FAD-dependent oxidoreductase